MSLTSPARGMPIFVRRNKLDDIREYTTSDMDSFLEWEEHLRRQAEEDETISETNKLTLIYSRIGQGKFKGNVKRIESVCRFTKVDKIGIRGTLGIGSIKHPISRSQLS